METKKGTIKFDYDEYVESPWENSDMHGPVRKSNNAHNEYRSDKRPGERPLNRAGRNEYQFYYDWQEAVKIAVEDWGFESKAKALEMVQRDFDYLQQWINGEWYYVFVTVTYEGETDTIGGVETWEDYHITCANEMLDDLIERFDAQKAKENTEREYWNSRDVCTVGE